MPAKTATFTFIGDSKSVTKAAQQASIATGKLAKDTEHAHKKIKSSYHDMARSVAKAAAVTAAVGGAKEAISAASDISESLSKNVVLFGKYASGVDKFSKTSAAAFGISRKAALEYTGVFGNLFSALGVSQQKSAGFSSSLTKLAADMASFNNTSIEDSLEAIRSGLVGETEPLRKFGVNLNDATLRQEAMSLGLTHTTKNVLTPYQKAMAAQALIVKQTEKAHGDFHRTQSGLANQTRIMRAELEDTKAEIGSKLIPVVLKVAHATNKFIAEMKDGTGAGGKFAKVLGDIWDEAKPIVQWLGRAAKSVGDFASKHPQVAKLAAEVIGVGVALKTIKFVGAKTGFTDLLKVGKTTAVALKRVLTRGGVAAGEAAAANTAESMASQMPKSLGARQGKIAASFKSAGSLAGKAFGVVAGLAAIAAIANELGKGDALNKTSAKTYGGGLVGSVLHTLSDIGNAPINAFGKVAGLHGKKAAGGLIPGTGNQDTVPAMLMPGEYVIRKAVVEKFGPTYFAALNSGQAPQHKTGGGIIAKANAIDAKAFPYVWGGGHSRTGVPDGGTGRDPGTGFDCSGAVSAILGVSPPRVSGAFTSWGLPGPGSPNDTKVYANAEHIFAVLNGRGWGTSRENPGGGAGWLSYNTRPGFTVRHLEDGGQKGKGGAGQPRESGGSGASSSVAASRPSASERHAKQGSRLYSKLSKPFTGAIGAAMKTAAGLATRIEDAGTAYGQLERLQGQSDEDLGTAGGRGKRIGEIGALKKEKLLQLGREKKRAAALKTAIAKLDAELSAMTKKLGEKKKGRYVLHGAKRAKFLERMKVPDDRRTDLRAELKALGVAIADTQLDIGDLDKEAADVAATADTAADTPDAPDPGPSTTDKVSGALSHIDALERAGDMSPADAQAARIATLQGALAGGYGALTADETLNLRGDLKDATSALTVATTGLAEAIKANTDAIEAQNAFARSVVATENFQLTKSLADIISGQIAGYGVAGLSLSAGSGALARYSPSCI